MDVKDKSKKEPEKEKCEHCKDSEECCKKCENCAGMEEKVRELENSWKRALADYRNLEKRFSEEKQNIVKYANFTLVLELIPVLDNLEMVENHLKDEGLSLSVKSFRTILKNEGVEEIEALGKEFDPNLMNAVSTVLGEENKVMKIEKKGYYFNNKVVRPAQVAVGKGGNKNV